MKLLHQTKSGPDTLYVFEDEGTRILKINQLSETHSVYNPIDPLIEPLQGHYWNYITILPYLTPMKSSCVLGLGAGTITRQLAMFHPTLLIDGIERDSEIIRVGSTFFELHQENLTIIHDDGIEFLKHQHRTYDLLVLDAFEEGNLSASFLNDHFFGLVPSRLTSHGIFAANYIFTQELHSKIKTLCTTHFSHVWLIQVSDSDNYIILASNHDHTLSSLSTVGIHARLEPLARYVRTHNRRLK